MMQIDDAMRAYNLTSRIDKEYLTAARRCAEQRYTEIIHVPPEPPEPEPLTRLPVSEQIVRYRKMAAAYEMGRNYK